jgi:phage tail sheath protein FI
MASTLTYPGVYIEEVPSGVRAITGVATSITAFVGWAARGPTDRAQLVLSWNDFERRYGGLDRRSLLGYSVQHFFGSGGQQAYIIRLAHTDAATATVQVPSAAAGTALDFTAGNAGEWANDYAVAIKRRSDDTTRFRVAVMEVSTTGVETPVESFENLSMDPTDRRFVGAVINELSQFIRVEVTGPSLTPPNDTGTPSPRLGSGTAGDAGTVLDPDTPDFEAALQAGGGAGGVNLLDRVDLFNLLCVPGETEPAVVGQLQHYCHTKRAFLIVDCKQDDTFDSLQGGPVSALTGADANYSALYFPWVNAPDLLQEGRPRPFPPCGFVAGLYARTDAGRGVWKAPAGTEASLTGVSGLTQTLTDLENGTLNIQAINCLRTFRVYGTVIWGARTLHGHNDRGSEWKYIPVRRMALFIEESLYRGTQWVVFEPNDEPLWAQIRLNVGSFLQGLFRQGAFQGRSPREAYFVKCDAETNPQEDINRGIVNIHVGFAPLRPAEFVVIRIQQMAGQPQT